VLMFLRPPARRRQGQESHRHGFHSDHSAPPDLA
jgi:hypothetical protein